MAAAGVFLGALLVWTAVEVCLLRARKRRWRDLVNVAIGVAALAAAPLGSGLASGIGRLIAAEATFLVCLGITELLVDPVSSKR